MSMVFGLSPVWVVLLYLITIVIVGKSQVLPWHRTLGH